VETTVYLIRHGVTDWHRERRLVGQRDIALAAEGVTQAHGLAAALGELPIGEIISSPALRSIQTAEIIAEKFGANITRDPRLQNVRIGRYEGMTYAEVERTPEYQRFIQDPLNERMPGAEDLGQVRDRAIGAVEQALRDAPAGESLGIVSHATIVRVVLAHYLGTPLTHFHRLRIAPASVSILTFHDDREPPLVQAIGWRAHLKEVL
jgi:broad specificity phosphatase PhoE